MAQIISRITQRNRVSSANEKLAGTPVYTWYQSSMVVDVSAENPEPSFHQALQ